MYEEIKERVLEGNRNLPKENLVILTWGNVSEFDSDLNIVAIKPSGVEYNKMSKEDIVVVDLEGNIIEGNLNPSSDLKTHLEIYKHYPEIRSIIHVHSKWATIFAQNKKSIPAMGTTHADYFYNNIPCTRDLSQSEIENDYELNTGKVIVETYENLNISPKETPAILVASHAPFIFGSSIENALENAVVLEQVAMMAWHNLSLNSDVKQISQSILDKHYFRKHGKKSYYGQL